MIEEADVIAIRRVHAAAGRDAALVELRRRCMALPEQALPKMLEHVLRLPVDQPPAYAEQGRPVMDNRRRAMRD